MKKIYMFAVTLGLFFCLGQLAFAQNATSLREAIENHYKAIHADERPTVMSHHLDEFSIFNWDGGLLWEPGFVDAAERSGTKIEFGARNVAIKHFSAQIYGNVGVATFYLAGKHESPGYSGNGSWRVTAVWVWKNGEWKEAHHHESEVKTDNM